MEQTQSTIQELELLKSVITDFFEDVQSSIDEKMEEIITLINNHTEELGLLEDVDNDEDDEDDSEEELTIQEKVNNSLLSAEILNQLQVVNDDEVASSELPEEAPVVTITTPPSLTDLIRNQMSPVAVQEPLDLRTMIENQVSAQSQLSVVERTENTPIAPTAPERPLGAIIAELRTDVNNTVEHASVEVTNDLMAQVTTSVPDVDSDLSVDLAAKIRTQLLTDSIKKQLS